MSVRASSGRPIGSRGWHDVLSHLPAQMRAVHSKRVSSVTASASSGRPVWVPGIALFADVQLRLQTNWFANSNRRLRVTKSPSEGHCCGEVEVYAWCGCSALLVATACCQFGR